MSKYHIGLPVALVVLECFGWNTSQRTPLMYIVLQCYKLPKDSILVES